LGFGETLGVDLAAQGSIGQIGPVCIEARVECSQVPVPVDRQWWLIVSIQTAALKPKLPFGTVHRFGGAV
jgi:hypothetical protein